MRPTIYNIIKETEVLICPVAVQSWIPDESLSAIQLLAASVYIVCQACVWIP